LYLADLVNLGLLVTHYILSRGREKSRKRWL
jgi:hypothetical protein